MLIAALLRASLWCAVAAALRLSLPRESLRPGANASTQEEEALFFIEKALLDPRCLSPRDDPRRCAPPRVFIWGQMKGADLQWRIQGCSTSALGDGTMEAVSARRGIVPRGFPFQVVCHFPPIDSRDSVALRSAGPLRRKLSQVSPAAIGTSELLVWTERGRLVVNGPPVEVVEGPAEALTGWSTARPADGGTIGSCLAIMFGRPWFVDKWIGHQLALGVDGLHMYTYDEEHAGIPQELRETIVNASDDSEARIELIDWPHPPWGRLTPWGDFEAQDNALTHCIISNSARYRWVLISDTNEFLEVAPSVASFRAFISSREQLWDQPPKLEVDTIVVPRDYLQGTPRQPRECREQHRVYNTTVLVSTGRVARISARSVTDVYDKASLLLVPPVPFSVQSSVMRLAHYAFGFRGCDETPANFIAHGVRVSLGTARSSEDEAPQACLEAYAARLDRVRASLGSEILAAWGGAKAAEAPAASTTEGPMMLEVGIGGATSAHVVIQAADKLGIGTQRRYPRLPRAGGLLDSERGHRAVLRLLGWDDAGSWRPARVHLCYEALQRLLAGGSGPTAPAGLQALLAELPPDPSFLDAANVTAVVAQHPTVSAIDWQRQHSAVMVWSPEALTLSAQCGYKTTQYRQEELSAVHDAYLRLMACLAPHVSVVDILPNATLADLSAAVAALTEGPGDACEECDV